MLIRILNICLLLNLVSCGLNPVYNKHINSSRISLLNSIKLNAINSIEGAEFYSAFIHLVPLTNSPKFVLNVSLNSNTTPQIIEKNSNISRNVIVCKVVYDLIDINGLQILTSGKFYLRNSFSIVSPIYNNYLEQSNLSKSLARSVATEIRNRLILYFHHQYKNT